MGADTENVHATAVVHPTAIIDDGVRIGEGVRVWHFAHIRSEATIGDNTIIGNGAYVGPGVEVGPWCKIQNGAQLFDPCILGEGVFVGPSAILTNDRRPRAVDPSGNPRGEGDWVREGTVVGNGAAIGAAAIVLAGIRLGEWAMVGAGSVVTTDIPPYRLAVGAPAHPVRSVCRCGISVHEDHDAASRVVGQSEEDLRVWCRQCYSEHDLARQSSPTVNPGSTRNSRGTGTVG